MRIVGKGIVIDIFTCPDTDQLLLQVLLAADLKQDMVSRALLVAHTLRGVADEIEVKAQQFDIKRKVQ